MSTPSKTNFKERKAQSFEIFNSLASTYDQLNHLLSFGIDIYWRKQMRKALPEQKDLHILDLACGTGDVGLSLLKSAKVKKVIGLDPAQNMLQFAQTKIDTQKLHERMELIHANGMDIPLSANHFDAATLSFGIRNYPDPQKGLEELHRILKPGGKAIILEFGVPTNFLVKSIYLFYFRKLLPFVGNTLSGHKDAYTYLNETVEDFPREKAFCQMMEKAGLKNCQFRPLTFGIAQLYTGEKALG